MRNHNWGHFRITFRQPKLFSCGSWFARCPYHKLSDKTACTKTLAIRSPDECDSRASLIAIYMWCNSALEHTRKRDHGAHPIADKREILPWSVVQEQMPTADPPAPLLTDEQLDCPEPEAKSGADDHDADEDALPASSIDA